MKRRINGVYLVIVVLLALAVAGPDLWGTRAQSPNRVGLVVRFGDGSLVTRCVEFSETEISGYDVLMRSGLAVVADYYSGQGAAICKIEHEGCPAEDCLTCAYPNYWSYWHLVNGAWVYSQAGSSGYTVHNGDVEGWSWGAGDPPHVVPFDQICAPPPTDTPPPSTDTPVLPTDTPSPTDTPVPPTATSPPATPEVWFRLDDNPIPAGSCTTVRWDTSNGLEVYLDGERVDLNGSREVCPAAPQEYHLRVVGAEEEQTHTLVLGVTGTPPSPTSAPQPTAILSPSPSPTLQPATTTSSPPSPPPQSAAVLSSSPSSTSQPAATTSSSPSPIPERMAALSSLSSPTLVTQPTRTSSSYSSTTRPTSDNQRSSSILLFGYVVFSLILIGLATWLTVGILDRK